MQKYQSFALYEIVNADILQEIQDKFSAATGLAAIIVDADGNPVTNPSNFTAFCKQIRSSSVGHARCITCDARAGRMALKQQRPFLHRCHSGLHDLAAPIIVRNEYLGAFLAGQVIMAEEGDSAPGFLPDIAAELGLDRESMDEAARFIEVVPEKRVKAAADLIYMMSNYIVEMGMVNIVQRQLMNEIKAKADLENVLRATELKALQSQINPHFLFNTLNTIARLALLEGAGRTQEVVFALSDLLRNNLRNIDNLTTLAEEIDSIKNYLLIQQVRFSDRIHVFINIPPEVGETKIPSMTLQPLVENAIIHGLEPKKDGGLITIQGYLQAEKVMVVIQDTGVGVTPERITEIFLPNRAAVTKGQTTGLGVLNVHKRIQHYFGPEFGVTMEANPGGGTRAVISLPCNTQ